MKKPYSTSNQVIILVDGQGKLKRIIGSKEDKSKLEKLASVMINKGPISSDKIQEAIKKVCEADPTPNYQTLADIYFPKNLKGIRYEQGFNPHTKVYSKGEKQ